jgi:site-specific recombinase XerD
MNIQYYLKCFSERLRILRYNPATIKNYQSNVCSFLTATSGQLTFNTDIDLIHIENYFFSKTKKESIGSSHQRIILVCISKFYDLVLDKKINLKHLYPKRSDYKLPFALSVVEVKKIIEVNENLKHKCIIMVLYSAGLRLSEVVQLKLVDIDFRTMTIAIRHHTGKKFRQVMLSEKLVIILKQYYAKYRPICYLFEGQNNAQFSGRSIQQIVRQSAFKSGVNKTVSPYILRHSFAIHLLEAGIDLRYIQELLGHADSKTTEIYTFISAVSKTQIKSPLDSL